MFSGLSRGKMSRYRFVLREEGVGAGAIAGVGVPGPDSAPANHAEAPVSKKAQVRHRKRNEDGAPDPTILRRMTPLQELNMGTFAGHSTIKVKSPLFHKIRNEKQRYARWMSYLDEDDYSRAIRQYANRNPNKPICLEDEATGYMCYARYGKK